MAIKPDPSPQKSIDNPNSTAIYIDTKIRQAAAKDIQRSYRNLKRSSSHNMDESSLTQTYLMLDRALSEAQSQKELCKNKQTINDDVTHRRRRRRRTGESMPRTIAMRAKRLYAWAADGLGRVLL
jgi:hypothetical protein